MKTITHHENRHHENHHQEQQHLQNQQILEKLKRCFACFFPNSVFSHHQNDYCNHDDHHHQHAKSYSSKQYPATVIVANDDDYHKEGILDDSNSLLLHSHLHPSNSSSSIYCDSSREEEEEEEEEEVMSHDDDGDHDFILHRNDYFHREDRDKRQSLRRQFNEESKFSLREYTDNHHLHPLCHDQIVQTSSCIFHQPRNHYHSPSSSSSFLSGTNQTNDHHPLNNPIKTKPIPCPIPNSFDENNVAFQREVEYYNKATWSMYNRIMNHRIKRQQEEQLKQQQYQKLNEENDGTQVKCDNVDGESREEEQQQNYEQQHHHQQQQKRKKSKAKNKKHHFSRKNKNKVQPLLDHETNKSISIPSSSSSSSSSMQPQFLSSSTNANTTAATTTTTTDSIHSSIATKNDNEVVFQLEF